MAFMIPIVKKDYDLYGTSKSSRQLASSSDSNERKSSNGSAFGSCHSQDRWRSSSSSSSSDQPRRMAEFSFSKQSFGKCYNDGTKNNWCGKG